MRDSVEQVHEELARSRRLAGSGDRPAAIALPDPAAVGVLLDRLCRTTRREFVSLHDPGASAPAAEPSDHDAEDDLDRDMLRRGVAIHQLTAGGPPVVTAAGIDHRVSAEIPFKLLMFDRSVALLPLDPGLRTLHHGALLVRDPPVIGALRSAARAALAVATPVATPPAGSPELPEHLRPVLAALLDGVVDTAAARRLGLSARTYTRRVAELLDFLGVRSRAQAGAAAARRGWIG